MNIEPAAIHRLKNKLSVILGFCELLISDLPDDSPHRNDLLQIQIAAKAALSELPPMAAHEFADAIDDTTEPGDAE